MQTFIARAGFLGAWLLVAGPIYQAAIEFGEEDAQRGAIEVAQSKVDALDPVSSWWWLLPPVHPHRLPQQSQRVASRRPGRPADGGGGH